MSPKTSSFSTSKHTNKDHVYNTFIQDNNQNPNIQNNEFLFHEDPKNLLNDNEIYNLVQSTLAPQRENVPYGATHTIKDDQHDRWYLQNVNGISTEFDWMEWKQQMATLKESKVDGFSFTETNLKWTPEQVKTARNLGNKWFKQFRMHTSSSNDPTSRKYYQPGGTCSGVTNKLTGRITNQGSDPSGLGRWTYFKLGGKAIGKDKNNKPIHREVYVITAYCVAQSDSSTPGHDTAFMQQKRMLHLKGDSNPKPRKQWAEDLSKQIGAWKKQGAEIMLCMDANADLLDTMLQKLLTNNDLVDLVGTQLGTDLPETYARGTKTIDHIFGTELLATAVKRVGYLAYNDGILSDHRGIFIDLCRKILFGEQQPIDERASRNLTTSNKKGARQYREHASKEIVSNKIYERALEIEAMATNNFDENAKANLEQLDKELNDILLEAEGKIHIHSHIPWSPQLHDAYQIWKYWKIRLSFLLNNRTISSGVLAFMKHITDNHKVRQGNPNLGIKGQLRQARLALRKCRNNAPQNRKDFMERIAIKHEIEDHPDKAKITKNIIRSEAVVRMYRTLRTYLKPTSQAITYVEVPEDPEEDPNKAVKWRKIFNKEELEQALHERNRMHFSQAATDRTPFTIDPLYSLLEFKSDTEFGRQFREGVIDLKTLDIDDDVLGLLEELLPKQDDPHKIDEDLDLQEVMSGFKKWNEQTTTGGRHLGHYKGWLMKRKDDEKSLTEEEFFKILITIYRTCVKNQYPLERWQTCLNLFIPKDPGSCKLHRLRVIHIVDTCLNFLRRYYIARRLLRHLEEHHKLATEQWGGRPGRTAIDLVMSKEMFNTIHHLLRKNGAITDVDATACYDRMVPNLIWLAYWKAGATWNIVQLLACSLLALQYYIVTAFGKSNLKNFHSRLSQFLGPGQGASDSPFAWALISTYLIIVYNKRSRGCEYSDPTGEIQWKRALDMFVDDSYLYHGIMKIIGAILLMAAIQQEIALWSKLLWVSGGAINYTKTFYTMMIWKFKPTGQAYLCKNEELPPNTVTLTNPSDPLDTRVIKRKCVTEAEKTLGVMKAADLSQTEELKHLKQKAQKFTKALVACPLTHLHAWLAYTTVYIPGTTYSSPTTSLTEAQCVELQAIIKPVLLKKMGLPPTLPNGVVYGDQYFGGIGFLQAFAEQGMNKTLVFLRHVRAKTDLGNQFLIGLRFYQLHAGTSECVLKNTALLSYLNFPWFDTWRQYLHHLFGRLELTEAWRPQSQRTNDKFIMDLVLQCKIFNTSELEMINACRLYLQVSRISDISTPDGRRILHKMLHGEYTIDEIHAFRKTTYTWPRQEKPNEQAWKIWHLALTKTACNHTGLLLQRLGTWNEQIEPSWKYWIEASGEALFERTPTDWQRHPLQRGGLTAKYTLESTTVEQPTEVYPTIPINRNQGLICPNQKSDRTYRNKTPATYSTFQEYLRHNTEPWEKHLLRECMEIEEAPTTLRHNLLLGHNLFVVSDGGDTDGNGYFGWVIANEHSTLCQGSGLSPGNQHLNESLRSESTAYLSALRFLLHYHRYYQVTLESSSKLHFCDNKSLVLRSPDTYRSALPSSFDFLKADYDVQMQIMDTIREMDIVIPTSHVKGHQDSKKHLSYEARLNIQADLLATRAWQRHFTGHKHVHYPASQCSFYINNQVITRAYRKTMRRAYASHHTSTYLHEKYKWDDAQCESVDWYSHGSSIGCLPHNILRFTQRFIINWLPRNKTLFDRNSSPTNLCQTCKSEVETERHFLWCEKNSQHGGKLHESLCKAFNKHKVDPNLRKLILQGLVAAISDEPSKQDPVIEIRDVPHEYKHLADAQNALGWYHLWYGRYHLEWDRYQRRYLTLVGETDEEPSGEPKWIRAVTLTIWRHCHIRWQIRCDTQYSTTEASNFKREQILHQIQTLYAMKDKLLQQEQYMFNITMEEWEKLPTSHISEWILKYKPVIKACLNTARLQLKHNSSDIRKFYPITANIPAVTGDTNRRRTTKGKQRKYKQVNLHNRIVPPSIITQKSRKKTKRQNTKTNTQVRTQVRNQTINEFFPPQDNRENHRKLSAKEKLPTTQATSSLGESNQFQSRSGD